MNLIEKARQFANNCHDFVNEEYDNGPYIYHLEAAVEWAYRFIHLMPKGRKEEIIAAIFLHDIIEGPRISYQEIKKEFGEYVAEIVFTLTPLRGRNRKEKYGPEYYQQIKQTPGATFAKLCDRLANVSYSINKDNNGKFSMYQDEHLVFSTFLESPCDPLQPMFDILHRMLRTRTIPR